MIKQYSIIQCFTHFLQDTSPENKLRLLMIYAATYPEKFEGDKGMKLMQVSNISCYFCSKYIY